MKCSICLEPKERAELVGANVFDALTGMHIITRWYCRPCAVKSGVLKE